MDKYKRVSVIGAARSGVAAAKLFKKKGFEVFLSDSTEEKKIIPFFVKEIQTSGINAEFGKHSKSVYEADLMIVSPGVPQDSEVIQTALKKGVEVVSEIEAASWFCNGKIISITGTNGKTTTTTLIGEIFKDAGYKALVCGNIGTAFSEVVESADENSVIALETSSFQLDNIKNFKPFIAILLNITPDHLDRYGKSYSRYTQSKMRVTENQSGSDYFVYNYDDEATRNAVTRDVKAKQYVFSMGSSVKEKFQAGAFVDNYNMIYFYNKGEEKVIDTRKLNIKGQHNVYNSMASVIAAQVFGIKTESIKKTLESFGGVEHRLEFVRELSGIKFYNDSKATNVNSVWYALQGFDKPIVLILGGRDKGNDYRQIEKQVKANVKYIVAIGESKQKVYDFFKNIVPVLIVTDMEDAVNKAASAANRGEIVLLSPACASFDMYENYEERGKDFKKIVSSL
ncbi:MAG: UDP-N-acetylmuramoyl-L-alanine--D-glutamate ligase [Chlorobi bacterium]|nr:UDP-N-acetylmuramoyl-L-alanine--D-glutamate ligase [Chlorobiota bacterium]MCI0715066.1 UDP-N-acetylmuramoyl-L-alanine--D-glutamate ligase [Chlorobiota bacterium]